MLQAIGKHIIIKAVYEKKEIIIHTIKEPNPLYYEVVSVGDEIKGIYPGDRLPYPQWSNHHVEHEREKFEILSLENITCKIVS